MAEKNKETMRFGGVSYSKEEYENLSLLKKIGTQTLGRVVTPGDAITNAFFKDMKTIDYLFDTDMYIDGYTDEELDRSLKGDFNKLKGRAKDYIQQIQDPIVDAFLSVPADDPEAGRNFFKAFKAYFPFGDSPDEEGDNAGISALTITNESQIDYTPRSQSGGMGSSMADVNKNMLPRGPATTMAGNVARSLGALPKAGPDSVGARR